MIINYIIIIFLLVCVKSSRIEGKFYPTPTLLALDVAHSRRRLCCCAFIVQLFVVSPLCVVVLFFALVMLCMQFLVSFEELQSSRQRQNDWLFYLNCCVNGYARACDCLCPVLCSLLVVPRLGLPLYLTSCDIENEVSGT